MSLARRAQGYHEEDKCSYLKVYVWQGGHMVYSGIEQVWQAGNAGYYEAVKLPESG